VSVKYFRTLASYDKWLDDLNGTISHKRYDFQIKDHTRQRQNKDFMQFTALFLVTPGDRFNLSLRELLGYLSLNNSLNLPLNAAFSL